MNERYYIGTGAKNCFYTLRYAFEEIGRRYIGDTGSYEDFTLYRDYHIRNLSIDRAEAIAKAREITGAAMDAAFEVGEINRRNSVDWSVLQGGKHAGKSIHELRETEEGKGYLLWLAENCEGTRNYGPTVELLKALLAKELEGRAADRVEESNAKASASAALAAKLEPIASVLAGMNGSFCAGVSADMRKGQLPLGRGRLLVTDIYAKSFGRRNSKAYIKAYDEAAALLAEAAVEDAPEPLDPMPTITSPNLKAWNERHGHFKEELAPTCNA